MKAIGTDIIKTSRLTPEVMDKFLSKKEKLILNEYTSNEAKMEFAAGRWAAKESIIKASNKEYKYSQIEILRSVTGAPVIFVDSLQRDDILVSISHEKDYSIAVAMIN